MSTLLIPRNWGEFQHYKDRSPPWIRLHKALLDNYDFQRLPVASRALAPMLWLVSSESKDLKTGSIEFAPEKIAFRLRMSESEFVEALKPLIDKGFFDVSGDASGLLAMCDQCAVPETETETEKRQSNTRVPRFDAQAHLESLDVDPKIAKDWLTLRKAKKAAPTETAIDGIMAEARKAGVSLQSALKISCERGWQGFKAEWLTNGNARASPVKSWSDANAETIAILTGRARDHEPDDRTFDV